ncbi:MAG TPA: TolC family protein [Anaeromyxobacteraceae bacterium]|nr:TolC family protein [Anaeromyxobacteraceae bacterium]
MGGLSWVALLAAPPALALQPLSTFVAGARRASTDDRVAALTAVQQDAEALAALGRVLPSATARGVYTRNEFESKLTPGQLGAPSGSALPSGALVIQSANQLDGYFQLDAPIIDAAGWARTAAARANARAARSTAAATILDVEKQVARNYYQLVGAAALHAAGERTLQAAQQNLGLARERHAGGVATELDVYRAASEVERARQSISDAELTFELSRRALRTLSGVAAEGDVSAASDDLQEESSLESWEGRPLEAIPSVAASVEQRSTAESTALAAKLAFLPTLSASAQEHLTNAPGFTGHEALWVLNVTAAWKLDVTTYGTLRSQDAAAEIARTREVAARQRALDQVHESWFRVHDGIAKSRAARAEAQAAGAAVSRARERYQQGAGTQLELVQAERDAFSAEVSRIQADADLSYARAGLRLDAGHTLDEEITR